jgi:hypothetical protein
MSSPSPTSRSLQLLRQRGYPLVERVEQRLPRCFITRDFAGCIDLLACRPGEITGVQVTSRSNIAARRAKALGCPGLGAWLQAGGRFVLHGWAKVGARGQRKTWQCAEQELTLADVVLHRAAQAASREAGAADCCEGAEGAAAGLVGVPEAG